MIAMNKASENTVGSKLINSTCADPIEIIISRNFETGLSSPFHFAYGLICFKEKLQQIIKQVILILIVDGVRIKY